MVFLFLEAVGVDLTAFLFWEQCAQVKSDLEPDCLLAPAGRNTGSTLNSRIITGY
jgi:hypothetical protein